MWNCCLDRGMQEDRECERQVSSAIQVRKIKNQDESLGWMNSENQLQSKALRRSLVEHRKKKNTLNIEEQPSQLFKKPQIGQYHSPDYCSTQQIIVHKPIQQQNRRTFRPSANTQHVLAAKQPSRRIQSSYKVSNNLKPATSIKFISPSSEIKLKEDSSLGSAKERVISQIIGKSVRHSLQVEGKPEKITQSRKKLAEMEFIKTESVGSEDSFLSQDSIVVNGQKNQKLFLSHLISSNQRTIGKTSGTTGSYVGRD